MCTEIPAPNAASLKLIFARRLPHPLAVWGNALQEPPSNRQAILFAQPETKAPRIPKSNCSVVAVSSVIALLCIWLFVSF